jgi:hypothetical protein
MLNIRKFLEGLKIIPKSASAADSAGELEVISTNSNKLQYHNGTSSSAIVTESHSATLTNKTLTSPVINTGVSGTAIDTDVTLAANSDTLLASQKAVKAYVDSSSGDVQADVDDLIVLSGVAAGSTDLGTFTGTTIPDSSDNKEALQALETGLEAHLSDTVDAHDASAISVIPSGNLAATEVQAALVEHQGDIDTINTTLSNKVTGPASATDEAVVRYDSTTGKLVQNSVVTITDAGIAAGLTGITSSGTINSTGTLSASGVYTEGVTVDSSSTGANATIAPTTPVIVLTNASLTSIDMISSPVAGKNVTIINQTGTNLTVNYKTGGTAANQIETGTKANLVLKDEAALELKYDSNDSKWVVVGGTGSSGSAGINYLSADSDAEAGVGNYIRYANSVAAATPESGTGGSPNAAFTFTVSTSAPLRDLASYLITKDANNRQGSGVSVPFTIASADQASILTVAFDYATSANYADTVSGNLIDSDIRIYAYDITNSQLIELSQQNLAANAQGHYVGTFQTASNSTSYRLIFHVASTSALAYTVKFDNVQVGPRLNVKGSVVTDWISYTPVTQGLGTISSVGMEYRRVGDSLSIRGRFTAGTTTAVEARIYIPSGLIVTGNGAEQVGRVIRINSTLNTRKEYAVKTAAGVDYLLLTNIEYALAESPNSHLTGSGAISTGEAVYVEINGLPIEGWSSNLVLSEDTGNRLITMSATGNAGTALTANTTDIPFTTSTYDSTASWSSPTYTAPETGVFDISGRVLANASVTTPTISAYVGGTLSKALSSSSTVSAGIGFAGSIFLTKGQALTLRSDTSLTLSNSATGHHLEINKRATPQTLAGSEVVACSYTTNTAQAVTNGNTVIFEDKVNDTHNAYNTSTGVYTVPVSGRYLLCSRIVTATVVAAVGNALGLEISNTTTSETYIGTGDVCENTASRVYSGTISTIIVASKGDSIVIKYSENLPAVNLSGNATANWMQITKVG